MRPRDAVYNGKAHISPAQLGDAGGVLGFDYGVDDGLRVNYDVDVIVTSTEKVVGFDHLLFLIMCKGWDKVRRTLGAVLQM